MPLEHDEGEKAHLVFQAPASSLGNEDIYPKQTWASAWEGKKPSPENWQEVDWWLLYCHLFAK